MMLYIDANLSFDKPLVLTFCYLYLANIVKKTEDLHLCEGLLIIVICNFGLLDVFLSIADNKPFERLSNTLTCCIETGSISIFCSNVSDVMNTI